jgi:RNA-binding protein
VELTGKQRRHLRSLGQRLTPAIAIGKGGVTEATMANLAESISRLELVKIKLPAGPERKRLPEEIAEKLGAVCAGVVGRTALLYRPNPELDANQRVDLP